MWHLLFLHFFDCKSVWGLTLTHQAKHGSGAYLPKPSEELGYKIGIELAKGLANSQDRVAEQTMKKLPGIQVARTGKDNIMVILEGIVSILI